MGVHDTFRQAGGAAAVHDIKDVVIIDDDAFRIVVAGRRFKA
jgi:hypothetical protein